MVMTVFNRENSKNASPFADWWVLRETCSLQPNLIFLFLSKFLSQKHFFKVVITADTSAAIRHCSTECDFYRPLRLSAP